ncbi:cupin domain-containing protein [Candidimonas sp. SYP-B2681]|uniref:cupin domain-containing protein n=1 Tax=Candidimonas sp. SYP-B2681 TaxID=2497686 RepID=UPI000F89B111|nr:cupin domain-containing protein [Candidimonas sp. SYP-B2681]RTZ40016.1 cupin domain-containing protein [Candidimonas sp. SYP-B2681]
MLVNLFDNLPLDTSQETFDGMLNVPGLRIERIVSHGQASPPGFWYQQSWDEWVIVLKGQATLQIEGKENLAQLRAGDHYWLPTGCRHRVVRTSHDGPTIWLAVHRQVVLAGEHVS